MNKPRVVKYDDKTRVHYVDELGMVHRFTYEEYKKFKDEKRVQDAERRRLSLERLQHQTGHDLNYQQVRRRVNNLKDHEIEDVAYHMVKEIEKRVQRKKAPTGRGAWDWIKTLRFGHNKITILRDEVQSIHIVVSGGKHNVNFDLEDEHGKNKFYRQFSEALGYKPHVHKRGGVTFYVPKTDRKKPTTTTK